MRTTVELPPDLMKKAKAHAAARGESLKALLTRAVAAELGRSWHPGVTSARVRLPLFGNPLERPVKVSSKDIASAMADDDVQFVSRARRRKK